MNHKTQQIESKALTSLPVSATEDGTHLSVTANELPSSFQFFAQKVNQVRKVINRNSTQTGQALTKTASGIGSSVAKRAYQLLAQATQGAGRAVNHFSNNWLIRKLTGFFNLNWILGATDTVDLQKAEAAVRKLQQDYPNESPSQIAHRIMVQKATQAGGIGLATSILPGEALAFFAVDLAATTRLQAEMVYQIAAAYGLDLQDTTRKGEVLAIFGLGLGGSRALKAAGLGLLRNVPFAGAVIGASSNATMIYSLGYAACRFYQAELDSSTDFNCEETLDQLKKQSEKYLENAIAQEAVMDQILVHMLIATHPEKSWQEILPDLQVLNLSPTSLEAIAANIKSPQPLDTLLNQLNRDFALTLLAQCYRISQVDGKYTSSETKVLEAIATKFDIDLNAFTSDFH